MPRAFAARAALAVQPPDHDEVLEAGEVLVDRRVLAGEPDLRAQRAPRPRRRRARRRAPCPRRASAASRGRAPPSSCRRRWGRAGRARCPARPRSRRRRARGRRRRTSTRPWTRSRLAGAAFDSFACRASGSRRAFRPGSVRNAGDRCCEPMSGRPRTPAEAALAAADPPRLARRGARRPPRRVARGRSAATSSACASSAIRSRRRPGRPAATACAPGTAMPPLLLDDDEAVAIAVGLRTAAGASVTGIEETAVRALVKLEQVLPVAPAPARHALQSATATLPATAARAVDPQALTVIAAACRDRERLRFAYSARDETGTPPRVEPHCARQPRPPLVPRRVGLRPRRLAHVPRRPDRAPGAGRRALPAARAARRGRRGVRRRRPAPVAEPLRGARDAPRPGRASSPSAPLARRRRSTPLDDDRCELPTSDDSLDWLAMRDRDDRRRLRGPRAARARRAPARPR